jgi:hypothetical protein
MIFRLCGGGDAVIQRPSPARSGKGAARLETCAHNPAQPDDEA